MYVRTLIFLTALIAATGNVQAGVISALWLEKGSVETGMGVFEANPASPAPTENPDEHQESLVCSNCVAGLAGVTASSGATSSGGIAWFGAAYLLPAEPDLFSRLRFDNDLPPDSPILSGLLKPS